MTTIDTPNRPLIGPRGAAAEWHEVERDFWVGNARGQFLGTIERHGEERFFARNSVRAYVGEYRTLERAQSAIAARNRVRGRA